MPKTLHVTLKETIDRSYPIIFGLDMAAIAGDIASWHKGSAFIITDSNVAPLYGAKLLYELGKKSVRVEQVVFPAGEESKTRRMKEKVEDHLIKLKADRHSLVIALGGGVVGDLAGFVAATLYRGIPFVQIPTSLLAQVDSSVGGKVAVDHPHGKNLIGAFYQPAKVYIDLRTLETLPEDEFRSGVAEVIKYGAIMDPDLFELLERQHQKILRQDRKLLEQIIARCCDLKARIVEQDERESGLRRILNFGHTIGHAVETHSKYAYLHGEAISIGMDVEAEVAMAKGLIPAETRKRLNALLLKFKLPTARDLPKNGIAAIVRLTKTDKKAHDGTVHYTLLKAIGEAAPGITVSEEEALGALERALV